MMEKIKYKKAVKRSPGYPMLGLEEAMQKAITLWNKDNSNWIPKQVALEHLGYKSMGGYATRVLAALKQFGLILEKKGEISLSQDGIDIALHSNTDEDYISAVKRMALNPTIYSKLFDEYNAKLPSDATLRVKLIKDYGFNPQKVRGFILGFQATVAFAGLSGNQLEGEIPKEIEQGAVQQHGSIAETGGASNSKKVERVIEQKGESIPILFPDGNRATLIFEKLPVQKEHLEKIKQVLDLFEDSFTAILSDNEKEV